jgi:hypothetical protein
MNTNLTTAEIEADLNATAKDIARLAMIADCLRQFINDSHGEDRSAFKSDLFKYQGLYSQAKNLPATIQKAHDSTK